VNLGKRFNHIVADKLAIKQNDVIAYRNNSIILTTKLDLLDEHNQDRITRTVKILRRNLADFCVYARDEDVEDALACAILTETSFLKDCEKTSLGS
jgi:hypothetical protein